MVLKTTCFDLSRTSSGSLRDVMKLILFVYSSYMMVTCLFGVCVRVRACAGLGCLFRGT